MVFFGGVFGFGERGDGEEELQQHRDGEDEVEERLEEREDASDPEAAGAREEELREEAVEDEDEKDEFAGCADDLAEAGSARKRWDECGLGVEAQAGEESERGEGELAKDRGGESDGFAAKAEAWFDDLLPGVDVVLVLAGEKLAHLGVDAVDVGSQGKDREEQEEGDGVGVGDGHFPPRLIFDGLG